MILDSNYFVSTVFDRLGCWGQKVIVIVCRLVVSHFDLLFKVDGTGRNLWWVRVDAVY